MKKQDDECSICLALLALVIAILSITIFLFPMPTEAPTSTDEVEIHIPKVVRTVYAAEIEQDIAPILVEKPTLHDELVRICACESLGSPNVEPTHYEADGVTVLTGRVDGDDTGMCQINLRYHGERAAQLDIDLFSEDGNIEFANMLHQEQGTQPWAASKHCWNK